MRVHVIAVGRLRPGPLKALTDDYAGRITWPLALREIDERKKLPPPELKAREGELLIDAVPRDAIVVALDARGTVLSSEALAIRLAGWRDAGKDVAFLIGGTDGLSDAVLRRAAFILSLGAMTWPHFLARGMLLEQLYRAQQILAGHPYHHA